MYVEIDKIQYFHGMKAKGYDKEFTICCEVPTKGLLSTNMTPSGTFTFKVGRTYVSSKDRYCRDIGRTLSRERISETAYKIELIKFYSDKCHFYFSDTQGRLLVFEMKQDRKKVYLVDAT